MTSWSVQALGWAGSALLVFSLLQARVLRFRLLNLVASCTLTVFNAMLMVWPMVAMNLVIAGINVWFIVRLVRERGDEKVYEVVAVGPDESYLQHFLKVQAADIARYFPRFDASPGTGGLGDGRSAYLVERGNETVGVVVVRDSGDGIARVELDYVTPRFRDFSPGEFVYRSSGMFRGKGIRQIVTPSGMVNPYYERLGFRPEGDHWVADVPA
ncbi:hypothetical protein [Phycicoccus sp. Root101]|uniref:hypothetical protein n=1 Tax=Phycicoccus sp. Root101 TaxID=1736421 RepID=UPI00070398E0|nr:hypothetical protein [Phycicoccus sp. Root101]KQU69552.1 hypothetical protein ASC58_06725 [Phycicoccus sp. Root101]